MFDSSKMVGRYFEYVIGLKLGLLYIVVGLLINWLDVGGANFSM